MDFALDPNPTSASRPARLSPMLERLMDDPRTGSAGDAPSGFTGALSELMNAGGVGAAEGPGAVDAVDQKARFKAAARELVGMTFVLPILKTVRQDPFKSEMFHGGQGEEMFGSRMDEMLADRIASRLDTGLGDAIYRKFTGEGSLGGGVDRHG